MRDVLVNLGLTLGAAVWLWAWSRFLPRPPDRQIEEEFTDRPAGSLVLFSFVLFLVVPSFVVLALHPRPEAGTELPREESLRLGFIASLVSGPLIVAGVLMAARAQRQPWWTFGVQRGGLKSAAVEGVRVWWEWLPLVVCVNLLARTLLNKGPEQVNPVEAVLLGEHGPGLQWIAATAAVLRAPIVEELVFRGLFQTWFNVFTAWPGMLCASILFAAVHSTSWPDPIPLVLVGIMLGLAYQRTRNLLAPMVAHALFNGIMTVFALLGAK